MVRIMIVLLLLSQTVVAQQSGNFEDSARRYFAEFKIACNKKNVFWHAQLDGPILLVDPITRRLFANVQDSARELVITSRVFTGKLPVAINVANTSLSWNGTKWAMVMLPIPKGRKERINLLAHERFHAIQATLGFVLADQENPHLDQKQARIYLKLELNALISAITRRTAEGAKSDIAAALKFRGMRYHLYPNAAGSENSLELNEGVAEYVGFVASGRTKNESIIHFQESLLAFYGNASFIRSFAYQTIPLYGFLLQSSMPNWPKHITAQTNLAAFFRNSFRIAQATDLVTPDSLARKYGADSIVVQETARETAYNQKVAMFKSLLVDSPHLEISFIHMSISFDPRNLISIDDRGTVYPTIHISDKWGILEVSNGGLISTGWEKVSISLPLRINGAHIEGNGWQLDLNKGYNLQKDSVSGNYILSH